ncbi:MAG: Gfo/Idh/MocA family oxidoreductase [Armatimonadetes bacterium]|nr:Gfo/Idh/MocA family oxidoreductase [Armatimonadota bacterium]
MKTFNVGIIGSGGIANGAHLPALEKQPDVKVLAVCDINPEALKNSAERWNVPHQFEDYKKLLEMPEIDAVHICTPNDVHMDPTVDALKAGKHVLCEKPIGRNPAEGKAMVDAAEASGKKFMVAQCWRWNQDVVALKRFIDAGELGDVFMARVWAMRRRGIPGWGVFINKEKQGGGPLIDIGVHILDFTMYLLGNPKPIAASGNTYTNIGKEPGHVGNLGQWDWQNYTVEDYAAGFVRLDNGASLVIESSFAANIKEDKFTTTFIGTKGGAQTAPLEIYGEQHGTLTDTTPSGLKQPNIYECEIRAFYDAIRDDTDVPVTGEQALNVIKIIDGIYRSGDAGKEVTID